MIIIKNNNLNKLYIWNLININLFNSSIVEYFLSQRSSRHIEINRIIELYKQIQ